MKVLGLFLNVYKIEDMCRLVELLRYIYSKNNDFIMIYLFIYFIYTHNVS